jgi:aspartyl-tRNA(Asn)/glutamyl-tRNA(Gln) amidotransferase subunit A
VLSNYVPPYDATVTAKLRAAGAVIVGKLNCDEFAMGSTTESSAYKVRAIAGQARTCGCGD